MKKTEKKLKERIEDKINNDNSEDIQDLKNKIADIVIQYQNTLKLKEEEKEKEINKYKEMIEKIKLDIEKEKN